MNGIINIYKEKGFTSHDVVAKLRGILKQKKIGHTGTLDPDAVGVLPICLGNATKVCELLTNKDKTYKTVLKLGIVTDTQDMTGSILESNEVASTEQEMIEAIQSFVGDYNQIPPMYSALKVNGKKLYELAREGKEIERKPREVKIHEIQIEKVDLQNQEITMLVTCSKGTYIRTLCHDIGMKLNCGGCMKELIRTKVGQFEIEKSITLSQLEECKEHNKLEEHVIKVEEMFSDYAKIVIEEAYSSLLYNGNSFSAQKLKSKPMVMTKRVRVYDSKECFIAIYEYNEKDALFKPIKMFL